jgi:1-acyl-sn-glycerol-3-phosphate acyltransferase
MRTAPTFLAGALATLVVGVFAVVVRLVHVAAAVIDPAMHWWAAAWLRPVGMIPVDRRSPDLARIDAAAARSLGARHCLLVFPEGGVAGDGGVRRFKDGAFVIAFANQVPILPVAIYGTRAIWRPGHPAIRPSRVRVEVGTPVSTSGLTRADVDQLRDRVRGLIAATYEVLAAD